MRSIRKIKSLKGKTVILRADFNVPIKNGRVLDATRIKVAYPTIRFLLKKGAEKIIILSHHSNPKQSLAPVRKILAEDFPSARSDLAEGSGKIRLLENLRRNVGEEKNDINFAKKLIKLAGIYPARDRGPLRALAAPNGVYVNDAFSVAHRTHASVVTLPSLLPNYAGLRLEEEVKNLSMALKNPPRPFLFILGGAKFSTKLPLIKKFLKKADRIFVGGALANNFFREMGMEIGDSLVDSKKYGLKKLAQNPKIILPEDVVVSAFGHRMSKLVKTPEIVRKNEIIADIGPKSTSTLSKLVKKSKFILWNGPMGKYESGYAGATKKIWQAVIKSRAQVVIGGGDTLASLKNKNNKLSARIFISSGGGAMLEFLAKGTLPGLRALR